MAVKMPESIDNLVYFSRRTLADDKGRAIAWTRKATCCRCKNGLMGKPVENGKVKVRAAEYVCPKCGHSEPKKEHEASLTTEIIYDCPFPKCSKHGEAIVPFARKSFYGKKAIVFSCAACGEKLGITKKLASPKDFIAKVNGKAQKGSSKADDDDPDDDDF